MIEYTWELFLVVFGAGLSGLLADGLFKKSCVGKIFPTGNTQKQKKIWFQEPTDYKSVGYPMKPMTYGQFSPNTVGRRAS